MWSIGCVLHELLTGRVLFRGSDENDQIVRIVNVLGRPPKAVLERAKKSCKFFDREDIPLSMSVKDVGARDLWEGIECDPKLRALVDKCLEWDEEKRISAAAAL